MSLFRDIDLTVGNPVRQIILFAVPMFICGLVYQLYTTVDMVIVGRFCGIAPYSAVGATGPLLFFYFGTLMGLTGGSGIVTAQKFGARDWVAMRKSVAVSILIAAGFTVLFSAVFIPLSGPILRTMRIPDEIFRDARTYLTIIFAGTFSSAINNTAFSQARAVGDSATPLFWLCISAVLNVVLNIVFVAVFKWGVAGVAAATVLVNLVAGVGCALTVWRRRPDMRLGWADFRGGAAIIYAQLRTGIPMALQFLITATGIVVRQAALNQLGTEPMAGYSTGERIESFITLPIFMMGFVIATYAAQNYGANRMDRVRSGIGSCMRFLAGYGIFACVASLLFCGPVTRLFLGAPPQEVTDYVFRYLSVTTPFYLALSAILVYRNALQGLDYQIVPFLGGVLELIGRGAFVFPLLAWLGYEGVAATNAVAWISAALLDYLYYRVLFLRCASDVAVR